MAAYVHDVPDRQLPAPSGNARTMNAPLHGRNSMGEAMPPPKGTSPRSLPPALGVLGVSSALIGLLAWVGYGTFATRGIHAVISRDPVLAHRMASYAGLFSFAQLVLGLLAIGLGWVARTRDESSRLAQRFGASAIGLGVVVLLLLLFLV